MHLPSNSPIPALNRLHRGHWPLVLIWNNPINRRLKVGKERKPDASADAVRLTKDTVVGQRMIVEEQTRCDVERYEDVNGVVLVGSEDEEDGEHVEDPAAGVQQRNPTRSIWTHTETDIQTQINTHTLHHLPAAKIGTTT